ncbi:MAG: AAA family ATPase [Synechococcus sp.]
MVKTRLAIKLTQKQRNPRHVIVIAGASGCGKTHLIRRMVQQPHDAFVTTVLQQLECDSNPTLKRSTVERMQRWMDPNNRRKRKTRKLKHCLLIHLDLTSINHRSNLKLLHQIVSRCKRLDVVTLYAPPNEWRQRIVERMHTDDEPSMRAAVIAITARISSRLSSLLYHREYAKWFAELEQLKPDHTCMANNFSETILQAIPPQTEGKKQRTTS